MLIRKICTIRLLHATDMQQAAAQEMIQQNIMHTVLVTLQDIAILSTCLARRQ